MIVILCGELDNWVENDHRQRFEAFRAKKSLKCRWSFSSLYLGLLNKVKTIEEKRLYLFELHFM